MPPHCDSLDGPVVTAAREALDAGDVMLVLPFVPGDAEPEVRDAFERVAALRGGDPQAYAVAELWFFETVVRLHRAGEGAPYTGLKPAGLSVGPVIPLAEQAIASGSSEQLADFLARELRDQLAHRLEEVGARAAHRAESLSSGRAYVETALGYQVYCHHLYLAMRATDQHEAAGHRHGE
jgi:hypothetical protein